VPKKFRIFFHLQCFGLLFFLIFFVSLRATNLGVIFIIFFFFVAFVEKLYFIYARLGGLGLLCDGNEFYYLQHKYY